MKITGIRQERSFTGDATEEEEIAAAAASIKADVLKVSHHGSKTSSSYEFLQAVHPGLAVISVGADNKFGHPAPETRRITSELVQNHCGQTKQAI